MDMIFHKTIFAVVSISFAFDVGFSCWLKCSEEHESKNRGGWVEINRVNVRARYRMYLDVGFSSGRMWLQLMHAERGRERGC